MRKQARKEVMNLAETKRFWIWNEQWSQNTGTILANVGVNQTYIANAFAPPPADTSDKGLIGNEIINPLVVLNLTVHINWEQVQSLWQPRIPTIRVDVYLIAVNDALTNVPPIQADTTGRTFLFLRQPDTNMRWMVNKQNMVVLKHKSMRFSSRDIVYTSFAGSHECRTIKVKKQFRGKKTYEQGINPSTGEITQSVFLKGWNFYWMVINQSSTYNTTAFSGSASPISISADRYLYFKDF